MFTSSNMALDSFTNTSQTFEGEDPDVLGTVEQSLRQSLQLRQWWEQKEAAGGFQEEFDLIRSFNHPARAVGFFDSAVIGGERLPLMGVVQEMLYDRADAGAEGLLPVIRAELQEFVLRYFMRISDFRQPEAAVRSYHEGSGPGRNPFSWCFRSDPQWKGFGYSQLYYKLLSSGKIGRFVESEQSAIADLRKLGTMYEWIVAKVRIFDFDLDFHPFGPNSPSISIPLNNVTYLVLNQAFIANVTDPGPSGTGEYGFGYGLLRSNNSNSLLSYGPGHFGSGFQTIKFRLAPGGEIYVKTVFVVNRPERILNVPLDPVRWGMRLMNLGTLGMAGQIFPGFNELDGSPVTGPSFDPLFTYISLANQLTGGAAAQQFCISREQLEKEMLVKHFMEHYNMITGSLLTWRQIPDWLDETTLPSWVIHGANL